MPTVPLAGMPVSWVVGKSMSVQTAPPLPERKTAEHLPLSAIAAYTEADGPAASLMLSTVAVSAASTAASLMRIHDAPKSVDLKTPLAPGPKSAALKTPT